MDETKLTGFIIQAALALLAGVFLALWVIARRKGLQAIKQAGEANLDRARSEERSRYLEERIEGIKELLAAGEKEIADLRERLAGETARRAAAEAGSKEKELAHEARLSLLTEAKDRLTDAFKALSAEVLQTNSRLFLERAKETFERQIESSSRDLESRQKAIDELIHPLRESLAKMEGGINELEKARTGAYASLTEQIRSLSGSQDQLQKETARLVKALRTPTVRGKWGELQLKRTVEIAGLQEHCDYFEQKSLSTEEGRLRPDMIVRLPGNLKLVIDAKAPLLAFLDSLEEEDETGKTAKVKEHARQIRDHINKLADKKYQEQFLPTPEFVVLFLPAESFFTAALTFDQGLIEYGVERKVILATPTTLIALFKLIAYAWRQDDLARNNEKIQRLGRDLYERLAVMARHFASLGKSLDDAVKQYNDTLGSLESRVLVAARQFKDLGVSSGKELAALPEVERETREAASAGAARATASSDQP